MPFFDIRSQNIAPSTADRIDEIFEMVSFAGALRARLSLLSQVGSVPEVFQLHIPFRAVKEDPDVIAPAGAEAPFVIGNPVAGFKVEHFAFIRILEGATQRIGGFLIIIKHVMSSHALNTGGQADAESPTGHVHFMNSLIAHIAIPIIPLPVPIIVQLLAKEWLLRSRT